MAILLKLQPAPSLLLIQRAKRLGDPWSGDMAFPGGRQEPQDRDHLTTARRELKEETGLQVTTPPLWKLNTLWTKSHSSLRPMTIHPFVFAAPFNTKTAMNSGPGSTMLQLSDEATAAVWVPLSVFASANREYFDWQTRLGSFHMPCYYFQHHKIWGLTLRMIESLIKAGHLARLQSVQELRWTSDC